MVEDVSLEDERPEFPGAVHDIQCHRCGGPMRFIVGKFGPFYGCQRFPNCRGTKNAAMDGSLDPDQTRNKFSPPSPTPKKKIEKVKKVILTLWDRLMGNDEY